MPKKCLQKRLFCFRDVSDLGMDRYDNIYAGENTFRDF